MARVGVWWPAGGFGGEGLERVEFTGVDAASCISKNLLISFESEECVSFPRTDFVPLPLLSSFDPHLFLTLLISINLNLTAFTHPHTRTHIHTGIPPRRTRGAELHLMPRSQSLVLLALDSGHDLARVLHGAELKVPDTLPRSGGLEVRGVSGLSCEGRYMQEWGLVCVRGGRP